MPQRLVMLNRRRLAQPPVRRCWLAAALMLLASHAFAQAPTPDPIDTRLDACLASDAGQTTAGMVECTGAAIRSWDQRLNETYQQALSALDPQSRNLLRSSQRQWVAFRSAERAAQKASWTTDRGSQIRVQLMGANLAAIKTRVEELRVYLP